MRTMPLPRPTAPRAALLPLLPLLLIACAAEPTVIADATCGDVAADGPPTAEPNGFAEPCDRLASYRVFQRQGIAGSEPGPEVVVRTPSADLVPNAGFVRYALNTPLFSDYALKERMVFTPEGASAEYTTAGTFEFPVGTIIVKSFMYPADFRSPRQDVRLLETRLLIRRADGWQTQPYVWDADGNQAVYTPLGDRIDVSWTDADGQARRTDYVVPDLAECKECHSQVDDATQSKVIGLIGPKAKHLNRTFAYAEGEANQLAALAAAGHLSGVPSDLAGEPKLAVADDPDADLEARARAYLDTNCAHCHGRRGTAAGSGLLLDSDQPLDGQFGICKVPIRGIGGNVTHALKPGDPDASGIVFRMATNVPKDRMPRLGRTVIHQEGVELVSDWIASMDPADYPCGDTAATD